MIGSISTRRRILRSLGLCGVVATVVTATPLSVSGESGTSSVRRLRTIAEVQAHPMDKELPWPKSATLLAHPVAKLVNHARAIEAKPGFSEPFKFAGDDISKNRALDCLAAAAYFEAGDDPAGQKAVIQVALNRARAPNYPSSICAVVFQGSSRRTGCQFTFTCDGSMVRHPSPSAWGRARRLASQALAGATAAEVGAATHYHADYVVPGWSSELLKIATVGAHVFYRRPGRDRIASPRKGTAEASVDALASYSAHHDAPGKDQGEPFNVSAEKGNLAIEPPAEPAAPGRLPATGGDAQIFRVDWSQSPGRWAVNALGRCPERGRCMVLMYGDEAQVARNRSVTAALRDKPLLLFIRDSAGMTVAQWNCDKFPRSQKSQCLPAEGAALRQMLRDRR